MRLLERQSDGGFRLTENLLDRDISRHPYAILSHRWGQANEEVTFEDIESGTGQKKAGYEKIKFCGDQASRDGLKYFWVDSCCIKKSDASELSEAINSMYCWYSRAAKCYAYLSGVSTSKQEGEENGQNTWEINFRASEWFSRGWTLQELLAPTSVEFFSREHKLLGTRQSLSGHIHEVTGIALSALEGTSLSQFSVDERLKWAKNRHTTRAEDWAYCLFGIFEISMPLIYGEGRERAAYRLMKEINERSSTENREIILEELRKRLPVANEAPFNTFAKQHEPSCLPKTRTSLLQRIYDWADGPDEAHVFWLNGWAGTGKSTIARTIARRFSDRKVLGASFFFARGGGDVGNASKFVTTTAIQLASNVHALRRHISDALKERSDIASLSLYDQWQTLVLKPLSKLEGTSHRVPYILVVDALDECQPENDISMLLQIIVEAQALKEAHLRVFLTSRPEIPIRYRFSQISQVDYQGIILQDISRSIVDRDISEFLEQNLTAIAQKRSLNADWPGRKNIESMIEIAGGLFIWAATACKFIAEGRRFAAKRLDMVLKKSGNSITAPEKHLDEIYTTVLENSVSVEHTDDEKEKALDMLRQVLGTLAVMLAQLSASSLCRLLLLTEEDVKLTLDDLHSILEFPEDNTHPLRLHHPSFRDFLLNKDRCKHPNFWVDQQQAHRILAYRCIQAMSKSLKQDICHVKLPGTAATSVETSRVEQCLPQEVQYACLYWVPHLNQGGVKLCENDCVHKFLEEHFLHWLEALGWMGRVSEGLLSNILLESLALTSNCPNLHALTHDMKRFALYFRQVIEEAPLQVYSSALVFAPVKSQVRRQFEGRIPGWIQQSPGVAGQWNAAIATLEGHNGQIYSIIFSPDGKRLASRSSDRTVRLWDGESGAAVATLTGHSDDISSIAFSPDGTWLASGSHDQTVKLWDSESGAIVATLKGHSNPVHSIAFSPNGKRLVSRSSDDTIRLWDGKSGALVSTLEGRSIAFSPHGKHLVSSLSSGTIRMWDGESGALVTTLAGSELVYSIAFSPDGKRLASRSSDRTVRLWDGESGAAIATLTGHSDTISSIAFSPDGTWLASGSYDQTVRLWDSKSGTAVAILRGHMLDIYSIAFSPDGKRLVSSAGGSNIRLWNVKSSVALAMLEGDSIAFSPDGKRLVSSLSNGTIKLWDGESGAAVATLMGHSSIISSVAFSPNGKRLASGSGDCTVRLWDNDWGATVTMLKGHSDVVFSMAFSPGAKRLASRSKDGTIGLWDGRSGAAVATLKGYSIAFSPDGDRLASGSPDGTVRLWANELGEATMLEGHCSNIDSIAFSPDGKRLASGSRDRTVRLWDSESGATVATLEGHSHPVFSVAFSPDGKRLASGSLDRTVRLWDGESGAAIATLMGHSDTVFSITFSPDGKRLASRSSDRTIRLWDGKSGAEVSTLKGHGDIVSSIAFSPDGKRLASGSRDHTVRIWDSESSVAVATVEIGVTIDELSISTDGSYLNTNRGIIRLDPDVPYSLERPNLFVSDKWVMLGSQKLLWLPDEYRATCVAVDRQTMGLGHRSGSVSFFRFDLDKMNTEG